MAYVQAVKDGSLKEDILDQAVERILRIIFEYADNRAPQEFTMEKDHEEARHIAEESMVLLKNDEQILPLKASEKIAFIGGFAKKPRFQGGGSSHINCFKITNALDSVPSDAQVTYAEGFPADKDLYDDALAAEAIKTAAAADKVVIFAGLPDSFESEGYDRDRRLGRGIVFRSRRTVYRIHSKRLHPPCECSRTTECERGRRHHKSDTGHDADTRYKWHLS